MFARVSSLLICIFAFIALAAAACTPATTVTVSAPAPTVTVIPASQCNAGNSQCCESTNLASVPVVGVLLGLLGIVLEDLNVLVGITCTPINIIGIGGGSNCVNQPVCCENNTFNGIIAIGCVPINIFL